MKPLQLALFLCLALSVHSLQSSLHSYLARLRLDAEENPRSRSVEKRQSTAPASCPVVTCLSTGQQCRSNPYDTSFCTDCTQNVSICAASAQGNATLVCGCFGELYSCLQRKGGLCNVVASYLEPNCVAAAGPSCNCSVPVGPTYPISTCKYDLECLNNTVCTARPTLNETCRPGESKCGDSILRFADDAYTCSNTTRQCVRQADSVDVGDPCLSATECKGSGLSTCTGGVCVGIPSNGACTTTDECAFGLFCRASVCTPQLAVGSACSITDKNPCAGDNVCGAEGTCIAVFSKVLGASCVPQNNSEEEERNECALGTFCSPVTRQCRGPWRFNTCNRALNNTDCEAGTECNCATNGTYQCSPIGPNPTLVYVSPTCKAPFLAATSCMRAASCKGDLLTPGGCAMRNCQNEVNCLLNCYVPAFNKIPGVSGCLTLPTFPCTDASGTDGSPASTLTVFATLLFASLMLAIL